MNLKIVLIIALLLITGAATSAQTTPTSPNFSVGSFLDTSATPQSRQGWLGIGTFSAGTGPAATLDVRGVSVMDSLKVLGNAVVNNKMVIGGAGLPTTNGLKVTGGNIRVSALGGSNKKTICIQPNGVLGICNTAETTHTDKCSNITGIQTKLPYTYYEQGTGRAVTVNDPNSDGICTRTTNPKCSDGVDSSTTVEPADTDTAADAADGNCYVPIIPNQPTVTTRPSNALTASTFLATIGRPVLKIGNNWYVYDPLKDSETDTQNQVCLNGVVESPEQCDDGNTSNTDACINNCTNAFCGDYYVRAGVEQCDAGPSGSATCGAPGTANACMTITAAVCGDGILQGAEECEYVGYSQITSPLPTPAYIWTDWNASNMIFTGSYSHISSFMTSTGWGPSAVSNTCNLPTQSNQCKINDGVYNYAINSSSCQVWISKSKTFSTTYTLKYGESTWTPASGGGFGWGTSPLPTLNNTNYYTCSVTISAGNTTGTGTSSFNSSSTTNFAGALVGSGTTSSDKCLTSSGVSLLDSVPYVNGTASNFGTVIANCI